MDTFLLILSIILLLAGIAGSVLPVLPGPPLAFAGIILLHITKYAQFDTTLLVVLGLLTLFVTIADYFIPAWTTGKFGGSRYGTRGAMAGMIAGLFFGPLGLIAGPFIGAYIGELLGGENRQFALKSAIGSFIGFLLGTGLKLILSFVMLYYWVSKVFF